MKKLSILLALCLLAGSVLAGCGVADSYDERSRRISQINSVSWRELVDDTDTFMLWDRNTRLTKYHVRVGE